MVSNVIKKDAKWWMQKLAERGIGTRPFFYPMHLQSCLKKHLQPTILTLKNSKRLSQYGFYLLSGLTISNSQICKIAGD